VNKADVAIATITWARDAKESELLLSSLETLATHGLPIFVTDGGSGAEFMARARRVRALKFCESGGPGLWPQVRSSLDAARAAGGRFILYTEPDKQDFFRDNLDAFIDEARVDENTGVVLVSRTAERNVTFPPFQQYTESVIDRCCAEVIGETFDYSYGPFLLNRAVVPHLQPPREDVGWGWRPYAFGIAHRLGLRVSQVLRASDCPLDQRGESNRVYRMEQLAQSIEGAVLSTRAPLQI
jgi:hypothetical protein